MSLAYVSILVTLLGLVPTAGYMLRYHLLTRGVWKEHETGRHLMAFAGIIAVLLMFILFNNIWLAVTGSSYAARPIIGLILYIVFMGVLWQRWLVFEHAQRDEDVSDDPHERK